MRLIYTILYCVCKLIKSAFILLVKIPLFMIRTVISFSSMGFYYIFGNISKQKAEKEYENYMKNRK